MTDSNLDRLLVNKVFSRVDSPRQSVIRYCFDKIGSDVSGIDFFSSVACAIKPDIGISPSRILVCSFISAPEFFVDSKVDGLVKARKLELESDKSLVGTFVSDDIGSSCLKVVGETDTHISVDAPVIRLGSKLFPSNVKKYVRKKRIYSPFIAEDSGVFSLVKFVQKARHGSNRLLFNVHCLGYSSVQGLAAAVNRLNPVVIIDISSYKSSTEKAKIEVSPITNTKLLDILCSNLNNYSIDPSISHFYPNCDSLYVKIKVPCSKNSLNIDVVNEIVSSIAETCIDICCVDFRILGG